MEEEAVLTQGEHHLAGLDVFGRAACDLDDIAWPKGGQHAFSVNLQAQTAAAAQSVYCHG
jgi:hypothetical protein